MPKVSSDRPAAGHMLCSLQYPSRSRDIGQEQTLAKDGRPGNPRHAYIKCTTILEVGLISSAVRWRLVPNARSPGSFAAVEHRGPSHNHHHSPITARTFATAA